MPVYKDKERNTWYVRLRKKDINGEWKHLTRRGFATKREAQEQEARLKLSEVESTTSLTFYELYLSYLDYCKNRMRESSYYIIENTIKNHALNYFKNKRIDSITTKDYLNWQHLMNKKELSTQYKNKIHGLLVSLFNYGVKFHNVTRNIPSLVGGFKNPSEMTKKMLFWTREEFAQFISVIDDIVYKTFFSTLYYMGIRRGEALALTWNDISLETRYMTINKAVSNKVKGKEYVITLPKTKSSIRTLKMPQKLIDLLNDLYSYSSIFDGFDKNCFVFGMTRPLADTTIERKKNEYCKIAGVKQIRIHDFRHSHASLLINSKVNIMQVAQRLGHADIKMTWNTYSHLFPDSEEEVIKVLDND